MMKKRRSLLLLILILSGCSVLRDFSDVRRPNVDFNRMSIQSISFDGVTLLFDFDVNNPNRFGVTADQYSYEFFINENSFLSGTRKENLRIEKESTSLVQVPVTLRFSELYSTFDSLLERDSFSYQLSTEVAFDVPGLGMQRVPVRAAGEIPLPRIPQITFTGFDVKTLSLSGAEMEAGFRIQNPNSFGISLANTAYALNVNGREWLDTRLGETVRLGASEEETITVPIRLNASQMGSVLVDMMRGSTQFDYELNGSTEISADIQGFEDGETVPFNLSGSYRTE